jgi:hypothetical protein
LILRRAVSLILVHRATRSRTKTPPVALAGVLRFSFRLSGRYKMGVFFQIFDYFFADHFTFKPPQRVFD